MTIDPKNPAPGVYADLDAAIYHALEAASNSRLTKLKQSPAHMRWAVEAGEVTEALVRGDAAHACILQPDRFAAEYAIGPTVDLRTKGGKAEWEAFCAVNPGKCHVRGAEGPRIEGMRAAVWSHPMARRLLEAAGETELSAVWIDDGFDVRCKLRADKIAEPFSTVVDLKTTRDASRDAFERAIYNFGYHRQGANYLDGLAKHGRPYECYAIIAVESEPPFGVAVYQLDGDALEIGAAELRPLLATYAECEKCGVWGGYETDIQWIGVPDWAVRRHERTFFKETV